MYVGVVAVVVAPIAATISVLVPVRAAVLVAARADTSPLPWFLLLPLLLLPLLLSIPPRLSRLLCWCRAVSGGAVVAAVAAALMTKISILVTAIAAGVDDSLLIVPLCSCCRSLSP